MISDTGIVISTERSSAMLACIAECLRYLSATLEFLLSSDASDVGTFIQHLARPYPSRY